MRGRGSGEGQRRPEVAGARGPAGGGRTDASGLTGCGPHSVRRTQEGWHITAALPPPRTQQRSCPFSVTQGAWLALSTMLSQHVTMPIRVP